MHPSFGSPWVPPSGLTLNVEKEPHLVLLLSMRDDIAQVPVVQVAVHIWWESRKHLLDLEVGAGSQAGPGQIRGPRMGSMVPQKPTLLTSSSLNRSAWVMSFSLMLLVGRSGHVQVHMDMQMLQGEGC